MSEADRVPVFDPGNGVEDLPSQHLLNFLIISSHLIGCFHGMPAYSRQAYVQEVARVIRPGGLFMIWAIERSRWPFLPGVPIIQDKEIPDRFGQDFTLERVQNGEGRWMAKWYTLRRR